MLIKKIISGGQTGSDQAGLDVAIKYSIPHGGAIPRGRMTESGALDPKYNLEEMSTKSYPKRTEKNVVNSDGTVIFSHGKLTGGSLFTRERALQHEKPFLCLDMDKMGINEAVVQLRDFVVVNEVEELNIAGSRASKDSEIYDKTFAVVERVVGLLI